MRRKRNIKIIKNKTKNIKDKSIYFTSAQFENSLNQLKSEKESPEYILEYIKRARTYVSFYSNARKNEKFEEDDDEDDDDDEEGEEEDEKINNK